MVGPGEHRMLKMGTLPQGTAGNPSLQDRLNAQTAPGQEGNEET